jgi:hypothetical protein
MFFSGLASKSVVTVSSGLVLKSVAQVSWFVLQNRQVRFGDLGLKIAATVSWFGLQNKMGDDLSVVSQN